MQARVLLFAIAVSALCVGCDLEELLDGQLIITFPGPDDGAPPPDEGTIVSVEVGGLELTPPHTRGDRDFKDHGPRVRLVAEVRADADDNTIELRVYMKAQEWENGRPKSDYTTAEGWTRWHCIPVPGDMRIFGLARCQEATFEHCYVDDDHESDIFRFPPGRLVRSLVYTGDTSGDEAGCATGVCVDFNPVQVVVVEDA
jgi:hypothetical protein